MGRIELTSFEDWVRHLFDHPATGPQWFADPDAPFWAGSADVVVSWVTRLFDDPLPPLAPYSDAQLGQGFWYLISNGASDCMFALLDASVPLDARVRCLSATTTVFRRLFAARCTPHLSHLDEPGCGPLDTTCYMWWDLLPLAGAPGDAARRALDGAALDVMADVLALDAVACQESALHGLGHWHAAYPDVVEGTVDRFLAASIERRPELVAYARSARSGCVQ
jgi:hypothetical protein